MGTSFIIRGKELICSLMHSLNAGGKSEGHFLILGSRISSVRQVRISMPWMSQLSAPPQICFLVASQVKGLGFRGLGIRV